MSLLTDQYKPTAIADFLGLEKPKRICARLAANPTEIYLLFSGPSGMGKTTLALALAHELNAELHHIPSQSCTVATIEATHRACHYVPMTGKDWHLILIDEADQMSTAAQLALLSMMDGTRKAPRTIIVYTCNSVERFEDRFISRTIEVPFSSYGVATETAELLARIWTEQASGDAKVPNFARIVKESNNNVRASLMALQRELLTA